MLRDEYFWKGLRIQYKFSEQNISVFNKARSKSATVQLTLKKRGRKRRSNVYRVIETPTDLTQRTAVLANYL
jgi:hypothetical protein